MWCRACGFRKGLDIEATTPAWPIGLRRSMKRHRPSRIVSAKPLIWSQRPEGSPGSISSISATHQMCGTISYRWILLILWVWFLHATDNQYRYSNPERKHGSPIFTHMACCVESKIRTCCPILSPAGVIPRVSHTCERYHLVVGLAAFRKYSL